MGMHVHVDALHWLPRRGALLTTICLVGFTNDEVYVFLRFDNEVGDGSTISAFLPYCAHQFKHDSRHNCLP